jgi:hypothetical protein
VTYYINGKGETTEPIRRKENNRDDDHLVYPITDDRVLMAEEFKKEMLLEAQKKQEAGYPDDWREKDLSDLFAALQEEIDELERELHKIHLYGGKDFKAARMENAHCGIVHAFINDKLNAMELEAMLNNVEKDE